MRRWVEPRRRLGGAASASSADRRAAAVLGRAGRARLARPRGVRGRTAARATGSPSWRWCSRSWARRARPGRSSDRGRGDRASTAGAPTPTLARRARSSAHRRRLAAASTCASTPAGRAGRGPAVGGGGWPTWFVAAGRRRRRAGAWCVRRPRRRRRCASCPSFDPTRRLAEVARRRVDGAAPIAGSRRRRGAVADRSPRCCAAAEAVGRGRLVRRHRGRRTPAIRVQFGRPIGQFQAVKHRCADMLVALEAARAAVWDAARAFDDADEPGWAVAAGRGRARWRPRPAFRCAKDCIQVLGGIGYTWEHDAHLYLKRATALRSLLPGAGVGARPGRRGGGRRASAAHDVDRAAARGRAGPRPRSRALRRRARGATDKAEWNARRWPTPATSCRTGRRRGASTPTPVEQLVIDAGAAAARGAPRRTCRWPAGCCRRSSATARAEQQERFGPAVAAGRDHVVPDVHRARRRQRPGVAHHRGRRGSTAAGRSPARRCGPRWPTRGRLGHLPGPHRPRRAQPRRHRLLPAST